MSSSPRSLRIALILAFLGMFACASIVEAQPRKRASKHKRRNKKSAKKANVAKDAGSETVATQNPLPDSEEIDVDQVLEHAKKLAIDFGPRPANSPAAQLAAQYISEQLAILEIEVERQEVGTQVMPAIDLGSLYQSKVRSFTSFDANFIVRLAPEGRAKDKPLLLMAHYDSVPTTPGVVDNAVAVGLLLELARVLKRTPPNRPTILAFTAAEENGLMGARALAEKMGSEVGLAVSLDIIGNPGALTLNGLSSNIHQRWLLWLAEVGKKAKVKIEAPLTHRAVSRLLPEIERSDHGPFTMMGVPAIHLYHRSDEAIYLPYHTRHDTMAQVDRASVEDAAKFISMLSHLRFAMPTSGEKPGLWLPFPSGAKVVSSLAVQVLLVTCLLVALLSMFNLYRATRDVPKELLEGRRLGLGSALLIYVVTWLITGIVIKILIGVSGHPLPWAHAPGRVIVAGVVMAAAIGYGLAALATRFGTWVGDARYLMPATGLTSFIGFFMLAFGAFELAWIVLLPSAALGAVGGSKRLPGAVIALILAVLPVLGPLRPAFLREMIFNQFWMSGLPLFAYVGLLLMPYLLAVVFLARKYKLPTPRGRVAIGACAVVFVVAAVLAGGFEAPCSGEQYQQSGLTCEIEP